MIDGSNLKPPLDASMVLNKPAHGFEEMVLVLKSCQQGLLISLVSVVPFCVSAACILPLKTQKPENFVLQISFLPNSLSLSLERMASIVKSAVVGVGKFLCTTIYSKITIFFKFQPNTDSLRAKMKELSDSKQNIEGYLESTGKQGKVAILPVKDWIPKVNNIEGQWNSMEEDIKASQKHFCGCFPNCYLRYKLSKSSMEKIQEVKELMDTRANFPEELAVPNPQPESVQEMPGPSIVVQKAASELLDRLKELVLNDEIRKIGIWGMGGVGKTTLVSNLNNLMADGSLAGQDLDKVGIPQGDMLGCKIILTTRSLDVCHQMETDKNIPVITLNDEASWELFSKHVGELSDVEELKSLAREVAKECNGLPLAIKVVGCSMRGKERVEQWRKALRGLRASQPRNIERVEEDVFVPLKWSYDSLQGKNIQPCFLYCSLFPEDFSINEDELIRCWRAEGLIDESLNIEESLESGVDLIEKLKHSCMLEPGQGKGTVKMHDIVRDVAIWIASSSEDGNKFFVQSNMSWSKITKEGMHESINRASFVNGRLSEIPTFLATCSSLSTLFLQDNPLNKIPRDIFLGLKALRVLNLSGTKIKSLPKDVGELRALRILNLSGTTIKSLPKEVGELNNLRLLNLSKTYELERIEAQTISRLSSLEVLDMYESSFGWKGLIISLVSVVPFCVSAACILPLKTQKPENFVLQISFLPNSLSLSLERMASIVESAVVGVGKFLCNSIYTKIITFFKFQPNTDSLRSKMKELSDSKKNIEDDLESAGKQGKVAILAVKEWLPKVKDIEGQWNSMEEDITASQKLFCGCFPNCSLRYKLSKSSTEKIQEVRELIDTRANFSIELAVPNPRPESVQEMPGPSIVDQKAASELLDRLKELVLNDEIRKIGIWGMGGVGKTTLVSNLNNLMADGSLAHPFDIIILVTVSSILDLHGIQLQIASRLKIKEVLENERKESWAALLFQGLKKQKKFLLILDDIWEKIDLDKVGIPQGDMLGCKIILTTRSLDVCHQMETDKNIPVITLNDEASWELFSKHVGELPDVKEQKSLAREVAKECKGLPLAFKVVGCSMRGKERVEQWRKALRGLRASQPRNIERVEEDVFGPLKWSYDSLQGKNIQPCFLYCSLFPEDFSIEEVELIRCWRAEGLIDESLNIEESLDSGVDLIEKLKHSCMLEPGQRKGTVKMHDIVRDVAIWIASSSEDGNKFFVQSNMSWSKITKEGMHESINRASFVGGGLSEIPTFLATCSSLSTLFLQDNPLNKIPRDIFLGLKALRVLNLSGTKIKSLPKEVGELNNLRLLNLSEMRELERIEAQTISRLSSLEVLDMFESGYGWRVKGEVDEESVTLEELLHLEYLYYLRIRVSSTGYFPLDSTRLKRLKSFHFHMAPSKERTYWSKIDNERVVELIGDVEHLAKCAEGMLNIATCLGIKDCSVNRIGELAKSIPNLKELILFQIEGSDNIWEGMVKSGGRSSFPKLQAIMVIGCNRLKSLIPHDLLEQLHNLEEIYVRNCSNMEEIFGAKVVDENTSEIVATCSVVDSNAFPKLQILQLSHLPKLTYICQEAFSWPSLEIVRVWGCPNLRRLPFSTGNAKKIQEIKGGEEWWNELEWEDEETRLNLQKHFKDWK
ncbi:disease resistance protein At4g27190-like [Tasmannia lanceolata]|uniref:disease resistance protein At4g27190-like n=1 Tax=Tasmannia lanceolata TaxID=3420 RepID=UPI004063A296